MVESYLCFNHIPTKGAAVGGRIPPPPSSCWSFCDFSLNLYGASIPEKSFSIAKIYGPGTNFSTGGRIKVLPDTYIIYHLDHIEHGFISIKSIFVCIQHAKSSIKTMLSKMFEQHVDYATENQFSTTNF